MGVQEIETPHIHRILEKIWYEKTETASRLRGRIESILSYAAIAGYRDGDNPARWRGHLEHLVPARAKIQKTRHHAALPYPDIADGHPVHRGDERFLEAGGAFWKCLYFVPNS